MIKIHGDEDFRRFFNPPATAADVTCPFFACEDAKAKTIICEGPVTDKFNGRMCVDFVTAAKHYKHFVNYCVCKYWTCPFYLQFRVNMLRGRARQPPEAENHAEDEKTLLGLTVED